MVIQVYLNREASHPVFERILTFDPSIKKDTELLLSAMRILFGSHCIVIFKFID